MSWLKCHLCDTMINTDDDPDSAISGDNGIGYAVTSALPQRGRGRLLR